MKGMKKFLVGFLAALSVFAGSLGLAGCDFSSSSIDESKSLQQLYSQYVVYVKVMGQEPLAYEEWLTMIKENNAVEIEKVEVDEDGNLVITFTDGTTQTMEVPNLPNKPDEPEPEPEHECESVCPTCEKCLNADCTEEACADKCLGHHVCESVCEICGKCLDKTCAEEACADKCLGHHVCESVCETCGKCLDKTCTEEACADKCLGHHVCESVCEICGKCLDKTCTEEACADKCLGHHVCESVCEMCGKCLDKTCTEEACEEKCQGYHDFSQGLSYELLANNTYAVSDIGDCTDTDIVIPATYNGKAVTTIAGNAFYNCTNITSIVIPDSVATIGNSAFEYCSKLTSVIIPDSVTTISGFAFNRCKSLTSIEIPDSVTTINYYAFSRCSNLTSVVIPDSVATIDDAAFSYCFNLTSVLIPDSVTTIGDYAFHGCSNLGVYYKGTSSDWSKISIDNFDNAYLIDATRYYYSENAPTTTGNWWHYDENGEVVVWVVPDAKGVVYELSADKTYYVVSGYEGTDTQVVIAETYKGVPVTTIAERAFYNCANITSIFVPDSVTSIGYEAFRGCTSLTEVTLPFVGGSAIDDNRFVYIFGHSDEFDDYNNYTYDYTPNSLKEVTITGGEMSEWAFAWCIAQTVILGDGVTSIGEGAFYCSDITEIVIPSSVTSIGCGAFTGCAVNVYITDIIAWCNISRDRDYEVGDGAPSLSLYLNNELLTDLVIPDGVTTIGSSTFSSCSSLTSIVIPDSVTTIGDRAFYNCYRLTSVIIGDSVTTIGYDAFSWCSSLTSVYYKGTESDWAEISIAYFNEVLTGVTRYYYSEEPPTTTGRYWHYNENGEVVVW